MSNGHQRTIKILFVAANPTDTTRLRLGKECHDVEEALQMSRYRERFDLEQAWATTADDLQGVLLKHEPDIIHFSGHGSTTGAILVEDDLGRQKAVDASALGQMFGLLGGRARCVVLNACHSATQADAIAQHVDCLIGMAEAIGDAAAIEFSKAFYRALGYGKDVSTAFDLGCNQLSLTGLGEQHKPQLITGSADPATILFAAPEEEPAAAAPGPPGGAPPTADGPNHSPEDRTSRTRWLVASVLVPLAVATIAVVGDFLPDRVRGGTGQDDEPTPTVTLISSRDATDVPSTPTATATAEKSVVDSFEYRTDGELRSVYTTNAPGNEIELSLSTDAVDGDTSMKIDYAIRDSNSAYAGVERRFTVPQDWSPYGSLCGWVSNDGFPGTLVFQFKEHTGEVWKHYFDLRYVDEKHLCSTLSKSDYRLAEFSPRVNGDIDLFAIENFAFYVGEGGLYDGVLLLDDVHLAP